MSKRIKGDVMPIKADKTIILIDSRAIGCITHIRLDTGPDSVWWLTCVHHHSENNVDIILRLLVEKIILTSEQSEIHAKIVDPLSIPYGFCWDANRGIVTKISRPHFN